MAIYAYTRKDKYTSYIAEALCLALLLFAFFLSGQSGRLIGAAVLLPLAVLISVLLKKRRIPSYLKGQVSLIMTISAVLFVMLYYLTAIRFGIAKAPVSLSYRSVFTHIIPIAVIVSCSEIIRGVLIAREKKLDSVAAYFICLISELLTVTNLKAVTTFSRFASLSK